MRIEANEANGTAAPALPPATMPRQSFRSLIQGQRLSAPEARTLLVNAWTSVMGQVPEPHTSALLTAHWALETDNGRCMPGYNFAGIKATAAAAGKSFPTVEGYGPARRAVNARFRMYESAEAGAQDYVSLLARRYPEAIAAARAGDSAGFARALAHGGYFTAAPESYAAGLQQRLATLEANACHGLTEPPSALARAALDGVLHAFRVAPEEG